jgi:hypothetical protein
MADFVAKPAMAAKSDAQNTRVIKLHQRVDGSGGHYKSFLINPSDTFYQLKVRSIDKMNMKRSDLPFCMITINFQYSVNVLHQRGPLCPSDDELVLSLLEREELHHEDDLIFVFTDLRVNYSSPYPPSGRMELNVPSSSSTASLDLCTEFYHQPTAESDYDTIPSALLKELESISLKIGRLQIFHSGKDPWRCCLDFLLSVPHRPLTAPL